MNTSFFKGMTFGGSTVLSALPQGAAAGYGAYIVGQAARYYFVGQILTRDSNRCIEIQIAGI